MNQKRVCIVQTGRLGDTIIALPIARYYYNKGYLVDWIIHETLKNIFNYIDYVDNVIVVPNRIDIVNSVPEAYKLLDRKKYEKVIDLTIGFYGSNVIQFTDPSFLETFVHVKYHLANVDISEKWNFHFNRNIERENSLYEKIVERDYVLIHNSFSNHSGHVFEVDSPYQKIYFEKIDDYEIFDWYKVIINAKEVYCLDSSLCNFIDVVSDFSIVKKYFCNIRRENNKWLSPPLKGWQEYKYKK